LVVNQPQSTEARQSADQGDHKTTLEKLALVLSIVFENNAALRGFEAGKSDSEDAIRVVGFGIRGNDFLGGKTKRETKQLLRHKGEKLRALISLRTNAFFGGIGGTVGDSEKNETVLSVTLPVEFGVWNVRSSDVKVTCVPKDL
jgi:hypothetical protein